MNTKRIPGFQWAMMIFIFFIIAYALPIILKDFQNTVPFKSFVFDMSTLAPLIATIICLIVFKQKRTQLASLKLSISLKVIERVILALVLPLLIFIIAMVSFNIFADSFVLLQTKDLSVSILSIIIGQIVMAFFVELGFRSYLQNIVENKMNTFFASIIVGFMYSIWNVNIAFSFDYAIYSFLYSFAFSMIAGELIRATKGRTVYIATIFHASMSFGLVFLFNEELGEVFAMKVIALSTVAVAVVYILINLIIRVILYFFTKRNLDEVEENNYLDHVNEDDQNDKTSEHHQNNTDDVKNREHQDDSSTTVNEINQNEDHQQSSSDDSVAHGSPTAVQNHTNDDTTADSNYTEENTIDTEEDNSRANIIKENTPSADSSESDAMAHHNEPQEDNNKLNRHTNSAVEASTEKAHPNSKDASPRQHDTNVQETKTQNDNPSDNDNSNQRSPFDLKSKRGHRR
ncbi:CPBP family intramembrane glutamic endopeptidase [Staphylococcus shinii]|uniref:CPBP family intramembrane glutamic endopeptidase n=1 Tax=Staphylococcus shinii TaxID=2912228 RepID=UPI000853AA37|nr:CPBP family intramembrane glutamic endopeptidase [Staphylococcus shinii]OEK90030.1 lysostaphin resistance protein A [Staphylococcus shinii]QRA17302.1 lysostaphin resistance protein A [Staphylococcus shinii]